MYFISRFYVLQSFIKYFSTYVLRLEPSNWIRRITNHHYYIIKVIALKVSEAAIQKYVSPPGEN